MPIEPKLKGRKINAPVYPFPIPLVEIVVVVVVPHRQAVEDDDGRCKALLMIAGGI